MSISYAIGKAEPTAVEIDTFGTARVDEDVIRLAISIGGDSDTIADIAGSMAEIIYPIPEALREEALGKLPDDIKVPLLRAEEMFREVIEDDRRRRGGARA